MPIFTWMTKGGNIVENIRKKVKKRKIGALSRFMYDSNMPDDFLAFICNAFGITTDDLVLGGRYNNLQDLIKLPNPRGKELEQLVPSPMRAFSGRDGLCLPGGEKTGYPVAFPLSVFRLPDPLPDGGGF